MRCIVSRIPVFRSPLHLRALVLGTLRRLVSKRRSIPFLAVVLPACGRPMDIVLQERVLEGIWSGDGQIVASRDSARWHWSRTNGGVLECWVAYLPPLVLSPASTFVLEGDVSGAYIMDSPFPEVLSGKGPARFSGWLENDTLQFLVERTDMEMTFGPDDMIAGQPEREQCQRAL